MKKVTTKPKKSHGETKKVMTKLKKCHGTSKNRSHKFKTRTKIEKSLQIKKSCSKTKKKNTAQEKCDDNT